MATITKWISDTTDPLGKRARLTYSYDDGFTPFRLVQVQVVNESASAGVVVVTRQSDGQQFSQVFAANTSGPSTTTTRTINPGGQQRFDVSVDEAGRIVGAELAMFQLD